VISAVCILLCIGAIRISKWFYVSNGLEQMLLPESVAFSVPGIEGQFMYSQIGEHPFIAEYSREVQFSGADRQGRRHPLLCNTGGENLVNVYVLSQGDSVVLRLDDVFGEYLWDVERDEFQLVVRSHGRAFTAPLFVDTPNVSIGIGDNNPDTLSVTVDDRQAVSSSVEMLTGRFVGQIRGYSNAVEFVPAAIEGERRISKLDEDE
jgi:hypothetical protein